MLYESLLLAALLLAASALFTLIAGKSDTTFLRFLHFTYLTGVIAFYFIWQWSGGRQTLPMKTWRLRIVDGNHHALSLRQAGLRFCYALIGVPLVFGVLWALFDRDRQFWHDRMARTKIVLSPES
jgi:uncharacterized RDD family membrane protein YckC